MLQVEETTLNVGELVLPVKADLKFQILLPNARNSSTWWIINVAIMLDKIVLV